MLNEIPAVFEGLQLFMKFAEVAELSSALDEKPGR